MICYSITQNPHASINRALEMRQTLPAGLVPYALSAGNPVDLSENATEMGNGMGTGLRQI
jgi:hypothetical protein